mgnify:CR=1 FL=1|tara:strand:+ start:105 stop:320 length:216 start_codon:yes stop_codon:yes gene_type:complete
MDIKIESGIPIPSRGNNNKYEYLKQLKVGDSYVLPYSPSTQQTLRQGFERQNMKCAFRKLGDGNMRVWRTK